MRASTVLTPAVRLSTRAVAVLVAGLLLLGLLLSVALHAPVGGAAVRGVAGVVAEAAAEATATPAVARVASRRWAATRVSSRRWAAVRISSRRWA